MAAVVNYSPPWWVNLLHRLPHFNLHFETVSSDFSPEDSEYQKVGLEHKQMHAYTDTQMYAHKPHTHNPEGQARFITKAKAFSIKTVIQINIHYSPIE